MLRCLLLTLALVSTTYAVKCYDGCVVGIQKVDGEEVPHDGKACTEETVNQCEDGCATTHVILEVAGGLVYADLKLAYCANYYTCEDSEKESNEIEGLSHFECKMTTCDSELCNDPSKSGGDSGKREEWSSFAVHSISFVLFSAVFVLLF